MPAKFGTRDRDLRPHDPKINGLQGLTVEHFFVIFGDRMCINF